MAKAEPLQRIPFACLWNLQPRALGQQNASCTGFRMDMPPETMETSRLVLRPVAMSDASDIFLGYASDVEATRFMTYSRHRSAEESHQFVRRCAACWKDGSAYPWAILARSTGKFSGVIELRIAPPKADFGYILCRPCWGLGYATEAATAIVSWAIGQAEI